MRSFAPMMRLYEAAVVVLSAVPSAKQVDACPKKVRLEVLSEFSIVRLPDGPPEVLYQFD